MGNTGNIDTLLADEAITSISTYDRSRELQGESPWLRSAKDLETGMFSGDITAIEPGKAYFIVNSTASVTVEIVCRLLGTAADHTGQAGLQRHRLLVLFR